MIEKVLCKNDYGKHNKCVGYCDGECISVENCPYQRVPEEYVKNMSEKDAVDVLGGG